MKNILKKVMLMIGVVVGVLMMVFGNNIHWFGGNWFIFGLIVTFVCGMFLIDIW